MHEGAPKVGNSEIYKGDLDRAGIGKISAETRFSIHELVRNKEGKDLPLKDIERVLKSLFRFARLTQSPWGPMFVIEQTGISGSYTPTEAIELLERVLQKSAMEMGSAVAVEDVKPGDGEGVLDTTAEDEEGDVLEDISSEREAQPGEFELHDLNPETRYFIRNVLAKGKDFVRYKETILKSLVELFGAAVKVEEEGEIHFKIIQINEDGERIFHVLTLSEAVQALFDGDAEMEGPGQAGEEISSVNDEIADGSEALLSEEKGTDLPGPDAEASGSHDLQIQEGSEPIESFSATTIEGQGESMHADVETTFAQRFNIRSEELENVPGYKGLTEPQKKLLLENFSQLTLGYVQEEAARTMKEDRDRARAENAQKRLTFIRNGLLSVHEMLTGTYTRAKTQKALLKEAQTGGIDRHKDLLEQLVAGMPRVHETPEGELLVDLVQISERLKDKELRGEEYETLKALNSAAHTFARIPSEWGMDTLGVDTHNGSRVGNYLRSFFDRTEAKEREARKSEYLRAYSTYRKAQVELEGLYEKAGKSKAEVIQILAGLDSRVTQMRFLQTDPHAFEVLEKIDTSNAWKEVVRGMLTKTRSKYFVGGMAVRGGVTMAATALGTAGATVAASAISFVALPLVAAGFASMRSWDRTAAELRERDRMARKGSGDRGNEALNIISSADVREKTKRLIDRLSVAEPEQRTTLLAQLQARVEYIRDKQMLDRINYGDRNGVLTEQVQLNAVLGEALAIIAAEGKDIDDLIHARIGKTRRRLDKVLRSNQERIIDARHIMRERIQGRDAVLGASAAALGAVAGGIFAERLASGEDVSLESDVSFEERIREVAPADVSETSGSVEEAPIEATPNAEGPLGRYEVQRGDTLINIIKEKIPEISALSTPKAQDNAILNILGKLTAEQKESIGISSGNVDLIFAGGKQDVLDLDALHDVLLEHRSYIDDAEKRFGLGEAAAVNTEVNEVAEHEAPEPIPSQDAEVQAGRSSEALRRDIVRVQEDLHRLKDPLIAPAAFHEKTAMLFRTVGNVSEKDWTALKGVEMNKLLNSSYLSQLSASQNNAVRSLLSIQNVLNRGDVRVLPQNGETVEKFFNRLADAKFLTREGRVDIEKIGRLLRGIRPAQVA